MKYLQEALYPEQSLRNILDSFRAAIFIYWDSKEIRHVFAMELFDRPPAHFSFLGCLPPIYPEWLGDRDFLDAHGVRFPYICGEMARGIASVKMVQAAERSGFLGFFGAAGLGVDVVREAIVDLQESPGAERPWGINLIHSPDSSGMEESLVDLFLEKRVRRVSASAFMSLSPSIVRYMASGLHRDRSGAIVRLNHVFAKVSRPEVARVFMSPPPAALLDALVAAGKLTEDEAGLASRLPVAEDVIAEGDSGGHTDNRPLTVLLPALQNLRENLTLGFPACAQVRIGAAGGLGDPAAIAAAFALGAAFVLTGSVNQSAVESGLASRGKVMLARAGMADVAMAPSADMFEMGVKVQVLRKGTLFAQRATRLYEIYSAYESIDAIPRHVAELLERDIFQRPLARVWDETARFFLERKSGDAHRAELNAKEKLGLVCRWYLGQSSQWAIAGREDREMDFQIWCGPAQGAFNDWVKGSFLEPLENRSVSQIGFNLLEGAATIARAQHLRAMGVILPGSAFRFAPRPLG